MGVLLNTQVPNASILCMLLNAVTKHTVYGELLIAWTLDCLYLDIIFQYFDSCFIDEQTKVKES